MTIQAPTAALDPRAAVGGAETFSGSQSTAAHATPAPADPTDELLLARFLKGDRDALGALASRHESHLLGLACALLRGRQDLALDAVQDTWLRVIKYGRSFRSGSTVKTWLYRILINACKDTRSRDSRLRITNPERQRAGPDVENLAAPEADSPDRALIRSAIEQLSGDHKLLVLLCYHQGLTHPQAAEVLNIPIGTLKSRLNAALTKLREILPSDRTLSASEGSAPPEATA